MSIMINYISVISAVVTSDNLIVALVGYTIVFAALVFLYLVFSTIPKILNIKIRNRLKKEGKEHNLDDKELEVSGEVNAAISTAIYMYFSELHDEENAIITLKKISRRYSPWSSKIYGVMNNIRR